MSEYTSGSKKMESIRNNQKRKSTENLPSAVQMTEETATSGFGVEP